MLERIGLGWLALGCVALGLFPTHVIGAPRVVPSNSGSARELPSAQHLVAASCRCRSARPPTRRWCSSSRSPRSSLLTMFAVRLLLSPARAPRGAVGLRLRRLDARMQDTAEGFGQPIRHIFQPFFAMQRELPSPFDHGAALPRDGRRSNLAATPICRSARCVQRVADAVAWLQQGRIATYLLYSFVTLVVLLALVL